MNAPRTSYDEMPYFSRPFSQTHPGRLFAIAHLCGLEPPPVETGRVLELGCAAGGNLIPMALTLPDARFVGVDLSSEQVAEGLATIEALGLRNIELRQGDLSQIDAGWGSFDYVICHGVYSWVPRPVQDAILAVCRQNLVPSGLAFVSYNTFPGWRMRSMIRDMMLYHTRELGTPEARVAQARALLDYLVAQVPTETAYGAFLREELNLLRRASDSYLFHEHLEDENSPVYFHEWVGRVSAAGLRYLGEAGHGMTAPCLFPDRVREGLVRGSEEFVQLEQYRDFAQNRIFRSSLVCHAEADVSGPARWERIAPLHVDCFAQTIGAAPPLTSRDEEKFRATNGVELGARRPITKAGLRVLAAAWPASVPFTELHQRALALLAEAGQPEEPPREEDLAGDLLDLFANGGLALRGVGRPLTNRVSDRPTTSPLVRRQAAAGAPEATNLRHETSLLENYDRQILRHLDGEHTVSDLVERVVEAALQGELDVRRDGDPIASAAELREIFAEALPIRLEHHRQQGLLRA